MYVLTVPRVPLALLVFRVFLEIKAFKEIQGRMGKMATRACQERRGQQGPLDPKGQTVARVIEAQLEPQEIRGKRGHLDLLDILGLQV